MKDRPEFVILNKYFVCLSDEKEDPTLSEITGLAMKYVEDTGETYFIARVIRVVKPAPKSTFEDL